MLRFVRVATTALVFGSVRAAFAQAPAEPAAPKPPLPAPEEKKPEEDNPEAKGKFNAGVGARFPSGPDDKGKFGSFNWIAVDLKGRYNPSDFVSTYLYMPLAVKRPDLPDANMLGGFTGRGELGFGKTLGVGLTLGAMRQGAFLLSEKDYPYYRGKLSLGTALGPYLRLDLYGVYLSVVPQVVLQYGSGVAAQIPISARVNLLDLLSVSADAGVFTGPKMRFGPAGGGRIYAGASVDLKLKPIILHLGAGVASLITDPAGVYPSIKESIYFDLNVKYAK
jgi:hypothetical protein